MTRSVPATVVGCQPTAQIKGLWKALYDAGDVTRGWNNARWKVIWLDNRYAKGHKDAQGNRLNPGIACRWGLTAQFYDLLSSAPTTTAEGGASRIFTGFIEAFRDLPRPGQFLIPKRMYSWEQPAGIEDLELEAILAV